MITSTKLKSIVDQYEKGLIVIHFWAGWSGSAFLMNNILTDLKSDYQEKIDFLVIDVEKEHELVESLSIVEIPTLMFLNTYNNTLEGIYTGIFSKQRLKSELDTMLTKIQTIL